jgi:hypothetical protein
MGDKGLFFVRTGVNDFGNISRGKRFCLDLGLLDTNLRLLKGVEFKPNENDLLEGVEGVEFKPNENELLEGGEGVEFKPNENELLEGVEGVEFKPNENGLSGSLVEGVEFKPNENGLSGSLVEEKKLNEFDFGSFAICGSNENGILYMIKKNKKYV